MRPTEAQRLSLRSSLVAAIGESDTAVLMEAMPPIDYDTLATRDDLARTAAGLEAQIDALRTEMDGRFTMVDARFAQIDARFVAITAELRGEISEVRGEMSTLGGNLRSEMATQTKIFVGTQIGSMLGLAGLILGFG